MYLAQTTKDRIKQLCKDKKINMENMLLDCSLGVNAIRQISDTKGMASFSLAKIADYLNCSVDYLLGRTDVPNSINNSSSDIDSGENNLLTLYRQLNPEGRDVLIDTADTLVSSKKYKI